jgi:hypothetical protein
MYQLHSDNPLTRGRKERRNHSILPDKTSPETTSDGRTSYRFYAGIWHTNRYIWVGSLVGRDIALLGLRQAPFLEGIARMSILAECTNQAVRSPKSAHVLLEKNKFQLLTTNLAIRAMRQHL